MSRWFVVALLLATGCRSLLGLDDSTPRGSGGDDDDGPPHPDAPLCWGSEPSVCLTAEPTGRVDLGGIIDTNTSDHCVAHDPVSPADVCVIAARDVHVVASTSFVGTRAVIVIAADTLSIEAAVDIAAHTVTRIASAAPGSRTGATDCIFAANPEAHTAGAGGSHGGVGGDGGDSRDLNGDKVGEGGLHGPLPTTAGLVGGCRGQSGFDAADHFGDGGFGGGAIELVAGTMIEIADVGRVDASGGAGVGGECTLKSGTCNAGSDARGGGGGGAGGRIILDAPMISNAGKIFADGGGGGGGASHGKDGFDGHDPDGMAAALGGFDPDDDSTRAGPGGNGSYLAAPDGVTGGDGTQSSASFPPGAGGGGGGGAGVIRIHRTTTVTGAGSISPMPVFP